MPPNRKPNHRCNLVSQLRVGVTHVIWCGTCNLVCDLLLEQKIERDSCQTPGLSTADCGSSRIDEGMKLL
jgi:hypothetical protein